jgi:hypothetical protein
LPRGWLVGIRHHPPLVQPARGISRPVSQVNIVESEIRFANGSRIFLCHCEHEKHVYKYQGSEMDVLLIDEITHFTETMYRFLRGRLRQVGLVSAASLESRASGRPTAFPALSRPASGKTPLLGKAYRSGFSWVPVRGRGLPPTNQTRPATRCRGKPRSLLLAVFGPNSAL